MPHVMKDVISVGITYTHFRYCKTSTSTPKTAPARGVFRIPVKPTAMPHASKSSAGGVNRRRGANFSPIMTASPPPICRAEPTLPTEPPVRYARHVLTAIRGAIQYESFRSPRMCRKSASMQRSSSFLYSSYRSTTRMPASGSAKSSLS